MGVVKILLTFILVLWLGFVLLAGNSEYAYKNAKGVIYLISVVNTLIIVIVGVLLIWH